MQTFEHCSIEAIWMQKIKLHICARFKPIPLRAWFPSPAGSDPQRRRNKRRIKGPRKRSIKLKHLKNGCLKIRRKKWIMVTQNSEDNREIAYCSDSEPESSHILDLIPNDDENLPVDQNVTNQNPPVNRPHRCGICRKKVKSLISLTKHMNEHTKR